MADIILIVKDVKCFFQIVSDPRCDASEEFRKDQNNPVDLHELLTEIQSLRVQLERSIETNKTLHEKLEEQLSKEKKEEMGSVSAVNINYLFRQSQHYAGMNGTVPQVLWLHCRTCSLFKDALKTLLNTDSTVWKLPINPSDPFHARAVSARGDDMHTALSYRLQLSLLFHSRKAFVENVWDGRMAVLKCQKFCLLEGSYFNAGFYSICCG